MKEGRDADLSGHRLGLPSNSDVVSRYRMNL
mgnify:CR=1 FL=1